MGCFLYISLLLLFFIYYFFLIILKKKFFKKHIDDQIIIYPLFLKPSPFLKKSIILLGMWFFFFYKPSFNSFLLCRSFLTFIGVIPEKEVGGVVAFKSFLLLLLKRLPIIIFFRFLGIARIAFTSWIVFCNNYSFFYTTSGMGRYPLKRVFYVFIDENYNYIHIYICI